MLATSWLELVSLAIQCNPMQSPIVIPFRMVLYLCSGMKQTQANVKIHPDRYHAPPGCKHETDSCCRWTSYPCSLFEDWTYQEVQLTGLSSIMQYPPCEVRSGTIHQFDVMNRGKISALEKYSNNLWSTLQQQVRESLLCASILIDERGSTATEGCSFTCFMFGKSQWRSVTDGR